MAKDAISKRKEILTRGVSKRVKTEQDDCTDGNIYSVALCSAQTWSLGRKVISTLMSVLKRTYTYRT